MKDQFTFFPPVQKQFYFSKSLFLKQDYPFLYKPLKLKARVLWSLLINFDFIRTIFTVKGDILPKDLKKILHLIGIERGDQFQINQGKEVLERKITIIKHRINGVSTFYKIGKTDISINLIRNEHRILNELNGKYSTPHVLSLRKHDSILILETTYLHASNNSFSSLNDQIVRQLIEISHFRKSFDQGLIYSFSHGDFCPWNILYHTEKYYVIDWEMGGDRPLGYDLFTFIFQTNFLLQSNSNFSDIFEKNRRFIKTYFDNFQVSNIRKYLEAFVDLKILYEENKANKSFLSTKYNSLKKGMIDIAI